MFYVMRNFDLSKLVLLAIYFSRIRLLSVASSAFNYGRVVNSVFLFSLPASKSARRLLKA